MSDAVSVVNGAQFDGAVQVRDAGLVGMVTMRGDLDSQELAKAVKSAIGLTLPDVGKHTGNAETGAFWIGRDQWMIEAPGRGDSDFAADLRAQAPKASVTDQTDGFVAFEITSANGAPEIEALMAKLVNIDPDMLKPGGVTRTGLDHMSVFLIRRAGNALCVIGMRTLAGSLWHAIATAAGHLEKRA